MTLREHLVEFVKKLKSLRNQPSDYPALLWATFVFLGGAIDAVVIKNYASWLFQISDFLEKSNTELWQYPQGVLLIIVLGAVAFFVPILFSLLFTRWHSERKIVPPFYMHLIAFGLLLFFVYNAPTSDNFIVMYILGFYVVVGWMFQDDIVTGTLGKAALADDIIQYSLKAHSGIIRVQEILMTKSVRRNSGLRRTVKHVGETLKLRTLKNNPIQCIVELKEGTQPNETVVNMATYEEKDYSIEKTENAFEFARGKVLYLKDVFARNKIQVDECSPDDAKPLVDFVLDKKQGAITRLQGMPAERGIKIVVSVSLIASGSGLLVLGIYFEAGLATLIAGIGLAIQTFASNRP
jgi:hypothetical protein